MAIYTRTGVTDFKNFTTVDNNQKVDYDAGDGRVELQPDADVFGSTFDPVHWTSVAPADVATFLAGHVQVPVIEGSGVVVPDDNSALLWTDHFRREVSYADFDIVCKVSDLKSATKTYGAYVGAVMFASFDNWAQIFIKCRGGVSTLGQTWVGKVINGVWTTLWGPVNIGVVNPTYFRIKRLTTTGPSNNYFYFYTSTDGVAWTLRWSGQIRDATYFHEGQTIKPMLYSNSEASSDTNFEPEFDNYYQFPDDIGIQRYWNDSPEFTICDNGNDYAFDAGASKTWTLSAASATITEPGTSTVKFKGGYSDTGLIGGVTWVDATWQTIAQVNTNAAGGSYDGHRFLHFKSQLNNTDADLPTLTSFSVTGVAISSRAKNIFASIIFAGGIFK